MERGQGIEMTMVISHGLYRILSDGTQGNWEVLGQAVGLYINSHAPGMSTLGVRFPVSLKYGLTIARRNRFEASFNG